MAWTQTDLDRIDRAIATGELTVRFADGKTITYQSASDLERRRLMISRALEDASSTPRTSRTIFASFAKE